MISIRAASLLFGLAGACTSTDPRPDPPPADPAAPPVDELVAEPPLAAAEPPAIVDVPRDHADACADLWSALRGAERAAVPLATRCELAAKLAASAIPALSMARSEWWRVDADVIRVVPLIGPRGGGIVPLISDDETCPPGQATYLYPRPGTRVTATVVVELSGKVDVPTPIDLALALDRPRDDHDACTARFSWSLNQQLGPLRPRAPIIDSRRLIHPITISYNSAPAPSLELGVVMQPSGGFTVVHSAMPGPLGDI